MNTGPSGSGFAAALAAKKAVLADSTVREESPVAPTGAGAVSLVDTLAGVLNSRRGAMEENADDDEDEWSDDWSDD